MTVRVVVVRTKGTKLRKLAEEGDGDALWWLRQHRAAPVGRPVDAARHAIHERRPAKIRQRPMNPVGDDRLTPGWQQFGPLRVGEAEVVGHCRDQSCGRALRFREAGQHRQHEGLEIGDGHRRSVREARSPPGAGQVPRLPSRSFGHRDARRRRGRGQHGSVRKAGVEPDWAERAGGPRYAAHGHRTRATRVHLRPRVGGWAWLSIPGTYVLPVASRLADRRRAILRAGTAWRPVVALRYPRPPCAGGYVIALAAGASRRFPGRCDVRGSRPTESRDV